jgi:hypothetical protein
MYKPWDQMWFKDSFTRPGQPATWYETPNMTFVQPHIRVVLFAKRMRMRRGTSVSPALKINPFMLSNRILFLEQPNMDGLSIAASVAGLVRLSTKAIDVISVAVGTSTVARNVLTEANSLKVILHLLQDLILDFTDGKTHDRTSMIYINQLVATLTGCVCAFTDLKNILDSLSSKPGQGLWGSVKWTFKDQDLARILCDLQTHKSSLNLMLMIITWWVAS